MYGNSGGLVSQNSVNCAEAVLPDASHHWPGGIHFERCGEAWNRRQHVGFGEWDIRRTHAENLMSASVEMIAMPVSDCTVHIEVQVSLHQNHADHRSGRNVTTVRRSLTGRGSAAGNHSRLHRFKTKLIEERSIFIHDALPDSAEAQREAKPPHGIIVGPAAQHAGP